MIRLIERAAWGAGLVMLGGWTVLSVGNYVNARREVSRFLTTQPAESALPAVSPEFSLWSPARIEAWRTAQTQRGSSALGVLRIHRLHVEAPILEGTDDGTLNRAVGHIEGTALPGASGNSGLAGHRDSFFRALKDIAAGDVIEIVTRGGTATYVVERTWIVQPEDVWVLDPTEAPAITLVTCYPFYFIGSAPHRFIVRAVHLPETTTPPDNPRRSTGG